MGEVSVMPHAWLTRIPRRISRSIIARGMADPPHTTVLRLAGISVPAASKCCNRPSQTVGTPADVVTPSRSMKLGQHCRIVDRAVDELGPRRRARPGQTPAGTWNIGTIGSMTVRQSTPNSGGVMPIMAWSTVDRRPESTPLGLPVVPLV